MNSHLKVRMLRIAGSVTMAVAVCVGTSLTLPSSAEAQATPPQGRPSRSATPRGDAQQREIEQQVQRRIGQMLKERLSLTDDQLRQLEAVTVKLERERRAVRSEDFRLRTAMRAQLMSGDSASNDVVAELLERMPRVERRRIELMETEQRELSQFLTPVQRARYMALQEEISRNMQQIRSRRSDETPGQGKGGPPNSARPPQGFSRPPGSGSGSSRPPQTQPPATDSRR